MEIQDEGSLGFWITHPDPNWWRDNRDIDFPEFGQTPIFIGVKKHSDGILKVNISGPFSQRFSFNAPCPEPKPGRGVFFGASWTGGVLTVFLNGKQVAEMRAKESPPSGASPAC